MTLKKWIYTFNKRIEELRKARGLNNWCYHCAVDIKIGDEVFSRNANSSKSKSKLYHVTCAKKVNII